MFFNFVHSYLVLAQPDQESNLHFPSPQEISVWDAFCHLKLRLHGLVSVLSKILFSILRKYWGLGFLRYGALFFVGRQFIKGACYPNVREDNIAVFILKTFLTKMQLAVVLLIS